MNKKELIDEIAARTGQAKAGIDATLASLGEIALAHLTRPGAEMTLPGLGKLKAVARAARTGRNPATGEEMAIPARTAVRFTAFKALKDAAA